MDGTPYYKLEHGTYYFVRPTQRTMVCPNGEQLLYACDQVAMMFDSETGTLYKHGDPVRVNEQARHILTSSFGESVRTVVFPLEYPTEEINKCLSHSGYIKLLAANLGLL